MKLPGGSKQDRAQQRILKQALRQLAKAENHAKEIDRLKERAQDVYLGRTNPDYGKKRNPRDRRDWRSRHFPRVAFEHAELKIAELCDSTPEWDARPHLAQYEPSAKAAELAVKTYLELDNFDQTFRTSMRRCVKYGDQPVKIIMKEDWATGTPRPTIIPLDRGSFLPDPSARDCCSAAWAFHRWTATMNDLRSATRDDGTPLYDNLDELEENPSGTDPLAPKKRNETEEAYQARTTGLHTIHERWTPWGVLAIANRKTIIRHDEDYENPIFEDMEIPFEVVRIIEDDDNLGGVSTMLIIEDEQELYWKFLNELVNAITLATRPPKLVDESLDPNAPVYAQIYPDAVIPARNGEQTVKIMQDVANLSGYGMKELIAMTRDHIERATGMNSTVAGIANANSATESSTNLAQAKSRIRLEIQQSDSDWCRVVNKFFSRIQQYCDPAELYEFTGGVDISKESFRGRFTTKLSSERALREQRQNNLTTLWNAIMPMVEPGSVEFTRLEGLLRQLGEAYDVGDLGAEAKTHEELAQQQQSEQLQMQQAQQQLELGMQQQMAQLAPPAAPDQQQPEAPAPVHESIRMEYKDAPPSIQRQMEALAGFNPATAAEGAAQLAALKPTQPGGSSKSGSGS